MLEEMQSLLGEMRNLSLSEAVVTYQKVRFTPLQETFLNVSDHISSD